MKSFLWFTSQLFSPRR